MEWAEYTGFFDGFEVCTMLPFIPAFVSCRSQRRECRVVGLFGTLLGHVVLLGNVYHLRRTDDPPPPLFFAECILRAGDGH